MLILSQGLESHLAWSTDGLRGIFENLAEWYIIRPDFFKRLSQGNCQLVILMATWPPSMFTIRIILLGLVFACLNNRWCLLLSWGQLRRFIQPDFRKFLGVHRCSKPHHSQGPERESASLASAMIMLNLWSNEVRISRILQAKVANAQFWVLDAFRHKLS